MRITTPALVFVTSCKPLCSAGYMRAVQQGRITLLRWDYSPSFLHALLYPRQHKAGRSSKAIHRTDVDWVCTTLMLRTKWLVFAFQFEADGTRNPTSTHNNRAALDNLPVLLQVSCPLHYVNLTNLNYTLVHVHPSRQSSGQRNLDEV